MKKKLKSTSQKKPQITSKKTAPKKSVMKKFMSRLTKVLSGKKNSKKAAKVQEKVVQKVLKKSPKIQKVRKPEKKKAKKVLVSKMKKAQVKKMKKSVAKLHPLKKVVKKAPAKIQKKLKVSKPVKVQKPLKVSKPMKVQKPLKMKKLMKAQKPAKILPSPKKEVVSKPVELEVIKETAPAFLHEPVMIQEVLEALQLEDKKVVVDGTLGLGGHSRKMLEKMIPEAKLIGFDVDDDNMATAKENLKSFGERVIFIKSNFSQLQQQLAELKIKSVDAILLDLGLSSPQVDNASKGFSFLREGPLDMRFDKTQPLTAADVVNTYGQNELIRIFREYGEEILAFKIAREIVLRRKTRTFKTTTELANFIEKLIGRKGHIHPATRVFQALRIEVNHELDVLLDTLKQAVTVLKKHGRIAVIAYHSLEDRVVKQFFRECARDYINEPDKLTTTQLEPTLEIVTKKPLVPTEDEIIKNSRSRSAKLRVAEKI